MRFEHLWQDLRYGIRLFVKSPGFTAIAVISIAFGTGANVAVFSAVDALLLRPLPVERPGELITIGSRTSRAGLTFSAASYPDFVDIRARNRSFRSLVAYEFRRAGISLAPAGPRQVKLITLVSSNFFDALGIELRLGRGFLAEEERVPGRDAVTVLSYGLWKQRFQGDPGVVGRQIVIAGTSFTVVGVTSESFPGIETDTAAESAYVPLAMSNQVIRDPSVDPLTARDLRTLTVKGRLRPGVSLTAARAELATIGRDLERAHPETNAHQEVIAQTEFQWRVARTPYRSGLMLIVGILSMAVLLVACANVAGLLASRAPLRAREIAVRLAVGAGRVRLVTQLLTESLMIALGGAAGGVAIGYAGISLLGQVQYPTDIVSAPVMRLDERALTFSLLVAMTTALLFGLGPALATTRIELSSAFRATEPGGVRRWRFGGRSQLVALQVALSLVVLTVAAITLQAFAEIFTRGPGFRTTQLTKISIDASQAGYGGERAADFFERAAERARQLPGAGAVALTSAMPLWSVEFLWLLPEGVTAPEGQQGATLFSNVVDEGYFDTMEIPLVAGRMFTSRDNAAARPVAIINDTTATRHWPGVDPVGRRFQMNGGPLVEIIGIVRTSMYGYPAEPPRDMVYLPYRQQPRSNMVLLTQTIGPSAELLTPLRDLVHGLDPMVPVYDAQTMERFYDALSTNLATVILSMVEGIGMIGVTITVIGLYGLVSYGVARRTREIGIRIAIGATYARVLRLLLRQGLTPAWVGIGAGLALSVAATKLMPAAVPFSHEGDLRALLVLVPVLVVVTMFAAFVPSRRAASVNPMVALRDE